MLFDEIVNLVVSNGLAVVIIAYFLFKDYKFNDQIINVLNEVKEVLISLKTLSENNERGD